MAQQVIYDKKIDLSRSFSKMKHMKNRLCTTKTMERLIYIALTSVEYLILRDVVSISFRLLCTDRVVVASLSLISHAVDSLRDGLYLISPAVDSRSDLSVSSLLLFTHGVAVSISSLLLWTRRIMVSLISPVVDTQGVVVSISSHLL